MKNFNSLAEYVELSNRMNDAMHEAELLKEKYSKMTDELLESVMSVLEPGEGMTARQISQSLGGIVDSHEVARRLTAKYNRGYNEAKFEVHYERVETFFRETTATGEVLPHGRIHRRTEKVNVYRAK